MRKEEIILSALVKDYDYTKKVLMHIQPEFFQDSKEKIIFNTISEFYKKYQKLPTYDVAKLMLEDNKNINESDYSEIKTVLKSTFSDVYEYDLQWLIDETEKFCKDKAVYNAIMQSVLIINGEKSKYTESQIPTLLQDALNISFDHKLGHDYFDDALTRFKFYSSVESKIPCGIDILNKVTNGGINRKTLNMFVAPPKAGKSLGLCSLAADYIRDGLNVLYISEELAEFRIGERIDANLFNIDMNNIKTLDEDIFMTKLSNIKAKTHGRLMIKEYPTKTASCIEFRNLIDDYIAKENFMPDILIIDYLGITVSSQYKTASNVNSYTYGKAVSEEMRSMAVDYDIAVWTAVQTNRSGMNASDFDVEDISESIGPIMTCDLAIGLIRTPELDEINQMIWKQLASRYGDTSFYKKFVVGIDKAKMKCYNVSESTQDDLHVDVVDVSSKKQSNKKLPVVDLNKNKTSIKSKAQLDDWTFDD